MGEIAYRKTIERLREAHLSRMADNYEALRVGRVSWALGHNRVDVVARHYLR